jgi:hypothetical protein
MKVLRYHLPVRSKILLSGCLAILLLLNTLVPHSCAITVDDAFADRILEGQSFLFECYTLSVLPLKLLEELYGTPCPVKSAGKGPAPEQGKTATAAGASLQSIAAEGIRTISGERTVSCSVPDAFCVRIPIAYTAPLPHWPPGGLPGKAALSIKLLLLLLMLLSRRIVEEDACRGILLPERKGRHSCVPVFFIVK